MKPSQKYTFSQILGKVEYGGGGNTSQELGTGQTV